jgi:hypothetical protein
MLNYIGRSQKTYPLFNGNIDEFRVYNYELSANEVAQLAGIVTTDVTDLNGYSDKVLSLWPLPANDVLHMNYTNDDNHRLSTITLYDMNGRLAMNKDVENTRDAELTISNLPSGIYTLKLTNDKETFVKKIIIKH